MTDTDTLREALEQIRDIPTKAWSIDTAKAVARRALATLSKPEPAAVAWLYTRKDRTAPAIAFSERMTDCPETLTETPLYASPVPSGGERAQIVAWLLRHADGELSNNYHVQRAAKAFADAIERGDHLSSIEEPRG